MSTVIFPFNQTGIISIGAYDTGTAWGGGGTGGNRISQNLPQFYDFLITGATAVGSGGYYMSSQTALAFTLMDTAGNVLNATTGATTSPPITANSSFQNTSVNLFPTYTMDASVTYWVRIQDTAGGSGLLQTNNLFSLTGPATPSVLTSGPAGYGPVSTFGSNAGAPDISSHVGYEGGMQIYSPGSFPGAIKAFNPASVGEYGMIRFKATIGYLWILCYPGTGSTVNLARVPADGSSGISTQTFNVSTVASGYQWQLVSNTLDSSTEYIYELSTSGNGGTILFAIMTSGGTGINTSVTAASLKRTLLLTAIGDSRVADVNGTGNPAHAEVGHLALLGQNTNRQILNAGVPGQALSAMAARVTDVTAWGVPQNVMIDGGVNDIKLGSPPTPTQLVGYMANLINAIRATGGAWATVPIYYQLIKPADSSWVSGGYAYFDTYNVPLAALAGQYAANTAPGQLGGADANVKCIDTRTWNLAGSGWQTGAAFNTALFSDGIHLNSAKSSPTGLGMQTEFGFLQSIFGVSATAITIVNSVPAAGAPSRISPPFSVSLFPLGGILTGTATVTPSDNGGAGSFTPSTVPLTAAVPTAQFQYTPSSTAGPRSVSITVANDKSLTNPGAITYTVQSEVVSVTAGELTFILTSTSSNWTGSPFKMVGGSPAVISSQAVTDTTHAQIKVLANGSTGPWTISDGTTTFTVAQAGAGGGTISIFNSSILGRG